MTDSILNSIKKLLGFEPEYTAFDTDITIHINSAFSVLHSLGACPPDGFMITGAEETWTSFLEDTQHVFMVKSYVYLKVRLIFDPPATSFAIAAYQKQIDEFEWRLNSLELEFNPEAYNHSPNSTKATWWRMENGEFPAESDDGDLGIDPETGNVWRDV